MPDAPAPAALLLVDVINDCAFEGGEDLARNARPTVEPIGRLAERAREAGAPVIYVNDNFGRWNETFAELVERCSRDDSRGCAIVRALSPGPGDHFVLKPKHSAFYLTSLDALLRKLGVRRLVICGYAADICVLFTANDAHMREYEVAVPRDCVASENGDRRECALALLSDSLDVDTRPAEHVEFAGAGAGVGAEE